MSGGMHRLWKNLFVCRLKPRNHEQILDMAGGTGDIAFRLHREGAAVTGADINPEMLGVGMERAKKRGLEGLVRSEEHTSELQSLMRISYGVFCLKKKNIKTYTYSTTINIHNKRTTRMTTTST